MLVLCENTTLAKQFFAFYMDVPHLIFDLDGTLIDSKPEILNTYRAVFSQLPPDKTVQFEKIDFGQALVTILKTFYTSEAKQQAAKQLFTNIYDTSHYEQTPLYPNVLDTLRYFQALNYPMYIATNKRYRPALRILEVKQLLPFFKTVKANEQEVGVMRSKEDMLAELVQPLLNKQHVYLIGDTAVDMKAAEVCGINSIAVLYGYGSLEELQGFNARYSISKFETLISIFNHNTKEWL